VHMQHGHNVPKAMEKDMRFVARLHNSKTSEKNVGNQYCSGALVAADTVLTAASCCDFRKQEDVQVAVNGHASDVSSMVWVDRYGFNPRSEQYNLCKITLRKPVPASVATPVSLDVCPASGCEPMTKGTPLVLAGYGDTDLTTKLLNVPYVSELDCNEIGAYNNRVSTVEMCVGPSMDKDADGTCQGDMGSPLVRNDGKKGFTLVGIASSGNGCRTPKSYALMTKINALTGWIGLQNVQDESSKFGSTNHTGRAF